MSTNMDGPEALIQEVLELPVEDLFTLLSTVMDKLRPLAALVGGGVIGVSEQLYDISLTYADAGKKIQTIKEVRALTGLGLKEAKDIVDEVLAGKGPVTLAKRLNEDEVEHYGKILAGVNALGSVSPRS